MTQLQTQNNALSSVNLNDEAAAMSTLESSYQAASQVFTMLNTIMASALNLGEQTTVAKQLCANSVLCDVRSAVWILLSIELRRQNGASRCKG